MVVNKQIEFIHPFVLSVRQSRKHNAISNHLIGIINPHFMLPELLSPAAAFELLADLHYLLDLNPLDLYPFSKHTEQVMAPAVMTMINVIALFKGFLWAYGKQLAGGHNEAASTDFKTIELREDHNNSKWVPYLFHLC